MNYPNWLPERYKSLVDRDPPCVWPLTKAEAEAECRSRVRRYGWACHSCATCSQDGWLFIAQNLHVQRGEWKLWTISLADARTLLLEKDGEKAAYMLDVYAAGGRIAFYTPKLYDPQATIIRHLFFEDRED